jgi:membrane-associated phospholipid phosphatase
MNHGQGDTLLDAVFRLDRELFGWISGQNNPVLDRTMPALSRAADHGVLWLGVAGLLAASPCSSWRRGAFRGVVSLAVASLTVNVLAKAAVGRPRPSLEVVPHTRRVRRRPVTTAFPSGHAASAAAFAVGAAREAPGMAVPLGVLAAGVAVSRVWTGAHYPADVVVGASIGALLALGLPRFGLVQRRR